MANGTRIIRKNPQALQQLMQRLQAVTLTVGIHASERDEGGGPLAVIAGVHEFGSQRIPARPFMRPTIWQNRERYLQRIRGAVKAAIRGRSLRVSLALVGEGIVSNIQQTIRQQGIPARSFATLSEATLERRAERLSGGRPRNKRFSGHRALIDTGRLINSIRWVLSANGVQQASGGKSVQVRGGAR